MMGHDSKSACELPFVTLSSQSSRGERVAPLPWALVLPDRPLAEEQSLAIGLTRAKIPRRLPTRMKILKEPLLHFLVLGALIFVLARSNDRPSAAPVTIDTRITITAATIDRIAKDFEALQARPPTDAELERLIERKILDEAYVREGFRRGLERDDPIVERRLREKMGIIAGESAAVPPPTDETLRDFLSANAESFRADPRISLRQMYFDPAKLGADPEAELARLLDRLRSGAAVTGHETLLPSHRPDAPLRSLAATFGSAFADRLTSLPVGEWSGPLRSGFGWHLVKVEQREPGKLPPLERIRDEVRDAWEHAEIERRLDAFNRDLLDGYQVTIERSETGEESP